MFNFIVGYLKVLEINKVKYLVLGGIYRILKIGYSVFFNVNILFVCKFYFLEIFELNFIFYFVILMCMMLFYYFQIFFFCE